MSSVQWAAVKIFVGDTIVPPQNSLPSFNKAACHLKFSIDTCSPPTIRELYRVAHSTSVQIQIIAQRRFVFERMKNNMQTNERHKPKLKLKSN